MDVGDVDVDLNNLQAGGAFDLVDDVAANVVADIDDGVAVLDDDDDINGGLGFALVDGDAAGDVGLGGGDAVGHGAEGTAYGVAHAVDAGHLAGGHAGDLSDDVFLNGGRAVVGLEGALGGLVLVNVLVVVVHVSLFH